jgi:hypothetical protein
VAEADAPEARRLLEVWASKNDVKKRVRPTGHASSDRSDAGVYSRRRNGAPNVRIPGKPPLQSAVGRTGTHPAVGLIRSSTVDACATGMAALVRDLRVHGIIQDYSQCVLLLRSTKNSPNFAGPYVSALQNQNIPVYNPRSKDFLEQIEVARCLGAIP